MANKIKIQHYVPRFYLRAFGIKSGDDFSVNCFDKSSGKTFLTNIRNIGSEKYFYDKNNDESQRLEKTLSVSESKFNIAYQKIIEKCDLNILSKEERVSSGLSIDNNFDLAEKILKENPHLKEINKRRIFSS